MTKRVIAAGAALVAAALASAVAAALTADVTLSVDRFFNQERKEPYLRFSGQIASGEANQYVTVMEQKCGYAFATATAGTLTRPGGAWMVESRMSGSATYRARWNGRLSAPVKFSAPIPVSIEKLSRARTRVQVVAHPSPQNLAGRYVELQRLSGTGWTRVRRARLVKTEWDHTFHTVFTVRTRGLRLRAFVPAATGAPCYTSTVSETWKS